MPNGLQGVAKRRLNRINIQSPEVRKTLDYLIYFITAFGLVMTIPQIWTIWVYKNAAGVSAISWSSYVFTSILWLLYGIIHKEKPLIVSSSVWIVFNAFVAIGAMIY